MMAAHARQAAVQDIGIDHRRFYVAMTEKLLEHADIAVGATIWRSLTRRELEGRNASAPVVIAVSC